MKLDHVKKYDIEQENAFDSDIYKRPRSKQYEQEVKYNHKNLQSSNLPLKSLFLKSS